MKKIVLNILLLAIAASSSFAKASDQSDVRSAVQSVFEQLKSHDYGSLYDL